MGKDDKKSFKIPESVFDELSCNDLYRYMKDRFLGIGFEFYAEANDKLMKNEWKIREMGKLNVHLNFGTDIKKAIKWYNIRKY